MTPADAAEILGVGETASATEIEAAFRRLARQSHPDLFAGRGADAIAAASAKFARVAEAHAVLLRAMSAAQRPVFVSSAVGVPPQRSPWLLATWIAMLVVATALSFTAGALPGSWLDLFARMVPFGVVLVGYAVTGGRVFFVLAAVLFVASAVVTLFFASFGSLLAFQVLLVPTLGLWYLGRRWHGRR